MRDNCILFVNKKEDLITFVPCRSQNEKKVFQNIMRSSLSDNLVCNDSNYKFNFPGGEIPLKVTYFVRKINCLIGVCQMM